MGRKRNKVDAADILCYKLLLFILYLFWIMVFGYLLVDILCE